MKSDRLGQHLAAILAATDPESTFEAARAIGERGPAVLPHLSELLAELAGRPNNAPVWGVSSALYWVLHLMLETAAAAGQLPDERALFEGIEALGGALGRLADGVEGAAIKIGTILGDELPRAANELITEEAMMPLRARLLDRCRAALDAAAGNGRAAPMTGAIAGLSQLALYVGPAMIRASLERAVRLAPNPKVAEVAEWALGALDAPEA